MFNCAHGNKFGQRCLACILDARSTLEQSNAVPGPIMPPNAVAGHYIPKLELVAEEDMARMLDRAIRQTRNSQKY